jgi:arylformamidase
VPGCIDLTMPLGPATPVWPGDPQVEVAVAATIQAHGYASHAIRLGSHNGTHIDAPAHMLPGGRRLGGYPVDRFAGRGRLVDLTDGLTGGGWRAQVAAAEPGEVVLLYTGTGDDHTAPGYAEVCPAIPSELVERLAAVPVGMVGVDAASLDRDPFPLHKRLLGRDVLLVENLVGLGRLRGRGFRVVALPLALDLEGAPARVIAELDPPA